MAEIRFKNVCGYGLGVPLLTSDPHVGAVSTLLYGITNHLDMSFGELDNKITKSQSGGSLTISREKDPCHRRGKLLVSFYTWVVI